MAPVQAPAALHPGRQSAVCRAAITVFLLLLACACTARADELQRGIDALRNHDYATARQAWEPLAEAGNAAATNNLGLLYLNGWGVPQDYSRATDFFEQSAQAGNRDADANLGDMYRLGQGLRQDYAQAAQHYQRAASNAHALCALGELYREGQGVPQDYDKAITLWRLATDQGNADAAVDMGTLYEKGQGVTQDDATAYYWFQRGAGGGNAAAEFDLGVMNEQGQSVTPNPAQALAWYQKAAAQAYGPAEDKLGQLYASGTAVARDTAAATQWYQKAIADGYPAAQQHLDQLQQAAAPTPPAPAQPASHGSSHFSLSLLAAGLKLFGALVALVVLLRKRKKDKLDAVTEEQALRASTAAEGHIPMTAPVEDFAVWNWPKLPFAAGAAGAMAGPVLILAEPLLLQGRAGFGTGYALIVLAVAVFMGAMAWALMATILRNRNDPVLSVNSDGILCRGQKRLIAWDQIRHVNLTQRKTQKSQKPIKGSYLLSITYMAGQSTSNCKVGLSQPSVNTGLLELILRAHSPQAAGQAAAAKELAAGKGVADADISLAHDPRKLPVSEGQTRRENLLLFVFALTVGLGVYGLTTIMDLGWRSFQRGPAFAGVGGLLGAGFGLALYLLLRTQLLTSQAPEEGTVLAAPPPGWRDVLALPLFLAVLGYLPVNEVLPQLANLALGSPYSMHFTATGKSYTPRASHQAECYGIVAENTDGGSGGRFCVTPDQYASMDTSSTLTATGLRSGFGSQLLHFTVDPPAAPPPPPVPAAPAPVIAPVMAPAGSAPLLSQPQPQPVAISSAEEAAATRCLLARADDREQQTLASHLKMAQSCADAHMPFE